MIKNINNNINEEELKKKLDELMEIEYEENIKNTEEIELENNIPDIKENIDSDNSSDNIIDTIYENNNIDNEDKNDSQINEKINNNNYSELNYISDVNKEETNEIIDLLNDLYLNEIEKEEGNAQNRFNLPLNKRIKSRLNNVEKKAKKKGALSKRRIL